MPARLTTPRLDRPRAETPPGSIGIGGTQCSIYSVESPGGFRVLGRTPLRLYDPGAPDPILLRAGDQVRFRAIDAGELAAIARRGGGDVPTGDRDAVTAVAAIAVAGAIFLWGVAEAWALQKVYRIGVLFSASSVSEMVGPVPAHRLLRAFLDRLRELGYVQGQNLAIEPRSTEGNTERHGPLAAELVGLNVDVIFTVTNPGAQAAKAATSTVPIVVLAGDPVGVGLVPSLARPGGNLTGFTFDAGPGVPGKRLELLKRTIPALTRVAIITGSLGWQLWGTEFQAAAGKLGLTVFHADVSSPADFDSALPGITRQRADGLLAEVGALNFTHRRRIVEFAAARRLPAMHSFREAVEDGALMAYSVDSVDLFRRAAEYVDRILKGAKPGDLPVQQPSRFVWSINRKTAKVLGVPDSVLRLADELIE